MTATLPATVRPTIQGAPPVPQVNLLPPEIRAGRSLGRVKTWLGIILLALLLVLGAVFVLATLAQKQAEQALAEAEDRNAALVAEQAQYAEVPQVLRATTDLTNARTFGMQSDVLWKPYLSAIAAVSPPEVSIDLMTVTTGSPWAPSVVTDSGPLSTIGTVGTVAISGRSLAVLDTVAWEDGLAALPGVTDVQVTSVQVASEQERPYYQVTASMQLTVDAFSARFTPEAAQAAAQAEATQTEQEEG